MRENIGMHPVRTGLNVKIRRACAKLWRVNEPRKARSKLYSYKLNITEKPRELMV